jgi:hypothetical protein
MWRGEALLYSTVKHLAADGESLFTLNQQAALGRVLLAVVPGC